MRRLALVLTTLGLAAAGACSDAGGQAPEITPDQPLTITRTTAPSPMSGTVALTTPAPYADGGPVTRFLEYGAIINRVAGMIDDDGVVGRADRHGLDVLDVTWEDTGREEGSALGPNISDVTLQVRRKSPWGGWATALMPVLRFPNFSDRTGDIPADKFFVRVGNEHDSGEELRTVKLVDVLKNIKEYVSVPSSIKGSGDLLAKRDTHFLVSAQAVFLPIPKRGEAEFNPVVFNYQSAPGSTADLVILVTRQGTSVQVIENKPEEATGVGYGQELYFNNRGKRADLTAQRRSDVVARIEAQGGPKTEDDRSAIARGADVMFLIQVPLKHKNRGYLNGLSDANGYLGFGFGGGGSTKASAGGPMSSATAGPPPLKVAGHRAQGGSASPDVEQAVVGHGPDLGPFREGRDLSLVRDARFPIRITVQFYKATSNGVVGDEEMGLIRKTIDSVYKHASFVGSLVVPEGDPQRPTAWQKVQNEWFPW